MMKRVTRKKRMVMVLVLVILLVLVGCRQAEAPGAAEAPEEEAAMEPGTAAEELEESEALAEDEAGDDVIEVQGKYVGFADSHSIEIELMGEAQAFMVFQMDEPVRKQLENNEFDTGTEVIVRYRTMEKGQPMILGIEAK